MGKGIRNKNKADRINNRYVTGKAKNNRTAGGLPKWVWITCSAVIVLLIVGSIALSVVYESGTMLRMKAPLKSDHYEVNGAMMQYYFSTKYQQFSTYLQLLGGSTSYPLDDETKNKCSMLSANDDGSYDSVAFYLRDNATTYTWWDYFMDAAIKQAKSDLSYCEAAYKEGYTSLSSIDPDAKKDVEETMNSLKESMKSYNESAAANGNIQFKSLNAYISAFYGTGVREKDVRNVVELSYISSKYQEIHSDDIKDKITDDDIDKQYEENLNDYRFVDYIGYTFEMTYDDFLSGLVEEAESSEDDGESGTSNEEYNKLVDKADAIYEARLAAIKLLVENADDLAGLDEEGFTDYLLNAIADEFFDTLATEEELVEVVDRQEILTNAVSKAKEAVETDTEPEGEATSSELVDRIAYRVYVVLKDNFKFTDEPFKDGTDLSTWIFIDGAEANDIFYSYVDEDGNKITFPELSTKGDEEETEDGEDPADPDPVDPENPVDPEEPDDKPDEDESVEQKESIHKGKSFSASFYMLLKKPTRKEDKAPNVGYFIINNSTATANGIEDVKAYAQQVLDAFLKGDLSQESFEKLMESYENLLASTVLEDYLEDTFNSELGYADFDEWLYEDGRKVGDSTVLTLGKSSSTVDYYCGVYYFSDGNEIWYITAKEDLYDKRFGDWQTETTNAFSDSITVNSKDLKSIG